MPPRLSPEQWQALSPQLDKALEMNEEQRCAWFCSLRTEDPSLVDQLEQLLDAHRALAREGFLDDCAAELPQPSGLAGTNIGAYKLISQIGTGGMGTVWLAERNDGRFERKVAVKFLNIALLGKTGEERFKREGIILGRLSHPHIAELIDAGLSQAGQPYLVLEYVEGDHVDVYSDRLGLDIAARIHLFVDVLGAVQHAHINLIVHRDLKPSNVLVRNDGQVKLLDFGIAKLLEIGENAEEMQLTVEGSRALTPEYAAPEQLTGQPITTVTDVYTLGVVLYLLLTGEHPTGTGTRTPANLMKAVLDTDPVRPSEAASRTNGREELAGAHAARRAATPEKLGRILRGDLDTIVAKALKKDPRERYASVNDFADDLRRYLKHEPIHARPDTVAYRASKFLRRHRGQIATTFLVISILVGVSVTNWSISHRTRALPEIKQRRLTANPPDLPVLNAVISPDGKYLGYADQQGIHLQVLETSVPYSVTLPKQLQNERARRVFGGWSPDSQRFLASAAVPGEPASLWSVSISGDGAQKISEIDDLWGPAKFSPDGTKIAYTRVHRNTGTREIWLMGLHGEASHLVKTAESQSIFVDLEWAPTGKRLVYTYASHKSDTREITVRSCDLEGRNVTTILRDLRLDGFAWVSVERFIYSRTNDPGGTDSDNLLELRVNENGVPQGNAQRLTDWSGFFASGLSSTADGKHLAFLRGNSHIGISIGDFAGIGKRIVGLRGLKTDDNYNIPMGWTPDSREIIFSSKRAENRLIYRQVVDGNSPAQLVTNSSGMNFYVARVAPDESALILEGSPNGKYQTALYRAELRGGSPALLFATDGFVQYWCTNKLANFCIFGEMETRTNELVITQFDPNNGNQKELLRIALEAGSSARIGDDYAWQLAPNGVFIAIMKRHENWVKLVPVNGGATKTLSLKPHTDLTDLNWAIDSHALFLATLAPEGSAVVSLDLNGNSQVLWQQRQAVWAGAMQSPDGHRVATWGVSSEANAWMIDDF